MNNVLLKQILRPSLIAASVALSMGISSNTYASTTTTDISPVTNPSITNQASATYQVGGVSQPTVNSNTVEVLISEVAKFSLVATQGTSATDDKNEDQAAPVGGGTTTFEHKLSNDGNVADKYTLTIANNNDGSIITDEGDEYTFSSLSDMTVKIYKDGGTSPTSTTTVTSGSKIELLPDEYAIITYEATTPNSAQGGQTDTSTITATSDYITAVDSAKASLINEDQAIVKMPVFKITKSSTLTNIDLNTTTEIPYTITIKNDGTASYAIGATNVAVKDVLPTGLTVKASSIGLSSDNATTTNDGTAAITTTTVANDTLQVTGIDLAVNETLTITFTAEIDKTKVGSSATNHATVYDAVNDSVNPLTSPNIKDSTDATQETTTGPGTSYDSEDGTGTGGDTPKTVNFSQRGLTITTDQSQEVPPTTNATTNADYTPVITNTGRETEGDTAGELTFTITDLDSGNTLNPNSTVTVTYDVDGDASTTGDQTTQTITPNGSGVYDVHSVFPSGIIPGGTLTINHSVDASSAPIGTTDRVKVTLAPGGSYPPAAGTTAATDFEVTDTTTVKGLTLLKEQLLDANCDGTPDTAFDGTKTAQITVTPDQCVVYKITATNPFASLDMTDVLIYDTTSRFDMGTATTVDDVATYQNNGVSSSGSTVNHDSSNATTGGNAVYTTIANLNHGQSASLTFSVKIKP